MKGILGSACLITLALAIASCSPSQEEATITALNTFEEKSSYAMGMDFANNLKRMGMTEGILPEYLAQGLKDALTGAEPMLTQDEVRPILTELRTKMTGRKDEKRQADAAKNKAEGAAFLAENKTKEGVQVTDSGLQYKVLVPGDGPKPGLEDQVKVHYRGTLLDGTEFDSSYSRGQPATFGLGRVIKGWTEGLQLMPVGSKYQFFIPSELAYQDQGAGAQIGPGATLIFEVELLEIVK